MPQDLPGFYYDVEKNRYFPVKGPIPGSTRIASSSSSQKPLLKPTQETNLCMRAGARTPKLIQLRELYGEVIACNRRKCSFKEEFLKMQASQPVVWKYKGMDKIGDGALEQILIDVHTMEGESKAHVLLTGGNNGSLSFFRVGKVSQHFDYGVKCMPDQVWPLNEAKQVGFEKFPGDIWRLPGSSLQLSSNISCIKLFLKCLPSPPDEINDIQHALISTLGSERSGGSLYILNLVEPWDFNPIPVIRRRIHEVTSLNCTIWTADCESNGGRAVVGTNLGAASVDLGTGVKSWILRSPSDVLAQQIIPSKNAVLCGLRNGLILTVDVRERPATRLVSHRIPNPFADKSVGTSSKQWFKLTGNISTSCTTKMPSSISSLVSLKFDDQYYLASSMDGSLKLYDHRLVERGAVQSYEGHVNSHTRIQLGIDPSEKFLVSGGEDCKLRLWSIKSGKLLFEDKFANSVPSTTSWRRAGGFMGLQYENDNYYESKSLLNHKEYNSGSGAWLGSHEGLFYMQWPCRP